MTREEAIYYAKPFVEKSDIKEKIPELYEALSMAINALSSIEQIRWERDIAIEQLKELGYSLGEKIRTSEDCISRADVRRILNHEVKIHNVNTWKTLYEKIDNLPSVQPISNGPEK